MDVIIEGPDGAGKTTLVEALSATGLYYNVPRASTSKEGPVNQLAEWVSRDYDEARRNQKLLEEGSNLWQPRLYDRHPIISEPIYGVITRGKLSPWFDIASFIRFHSAAIQRRCLVVFCLPPFESVRYNVTASQTNQMPGVVSRITELYLAYKTTSNVWPGHWKYYDYTTDRQDRVLDNIRRYAFGDNK